MKMFTKNPSANEMAVLEMKMYTLKQSRNLKRELKENYFKILKNTIPKSVI